MMISASLFPCVVVLLLPVIYGHVNLTAQYTTTSRHGAGNLRVVTDGDLTTCVSFSVGTSVPAHTDVAIILAVNNHTNITFRVYGNHLNCGENDDTATRLVPVPRARAADVLARSEACPLSHTRHMAAGKETCTYFCETEEGIEAVRFIRRPFSLQHASWQLCEIKPENGIRLANGHDASSGRVEVMYQGQWGNVCDDSWDECDALVACRMLGYNRGQAFTGACFGPGPGDRTTIVMDDVSCTGQESTIFECSHLAGTGHNCAHAEDAGVRCWNEAPGNTCTQASTTANTDSYCTVRP